MSSNRFRERIECGIYNEISAEACCLCGAPDGFLVAEKDRYGLPVKTVVCERCGLVRTYNRLDAASLGRFYGEQYRPIYEGALYSSETIQRFLESQFEANHFVSYIGVLKLTSASIVAEVGACAGWNLYSFQRRGIAVIGCDLDKEYLEYGRRRGIRLVEGDVKRLIELGVKADLVIVNHVLEHVADPIDFLLDLREIVKDEGHVLIGVPGLADVRYGYGDGEFWGCLQNAHLFFFELWTLRRCMERAGFGFVDGYEGIQALFRKRPEAGGPRDLRIRRGERIVKYIRTLRYSEMFWKGVFRLAGGNSATGPGSQVKRAVYAATHPRLALGSLTIRLRLRRASVHLARAYEA